MTLPVLHDRLIPVSTFLLGEVQPGSKTIVGVAAGERRWRVSWVDRLGERVQVTTPFGVDEWTSPARLRADDVVEEDSAALNLPEGVLAWAGHSSRRIAL